MKTLAYATLMANGRYGTPDTGATPEDVMADYFKTAIETGNVIVGRNTYNEFAKLGGAGALTAKGVDVVVLAKDFKEADGAVHIASTPTDALKYLAQRGASRAMIGGGAATITSFLELGLIDELCINILPLLSDKGLALKLGKDISAPLTLANTKLLGENVTQLHYKVIK